jgi:hypothetical protein
VHQGGHDRRPPSSQDSRSHFVITHGEGNHFNAHVKELEDERKTICGGKILIDH